MIGLIFDVKRFAVHDGPGIRVTAFLKGCPLQCKWCHNPESRATAICEVDKSVRIGDRTFIEKEMIGYEITPEKLVDELRKEKIFMEESGGGVTFSGGEPLMQADFLAATLALCKQEGFHTAVDTSGYASEREFAKIIGLTDLFLYDVKLIDDAAHIKYTGVSNKLIHNNLRFLLKQGAEVFIRMPMIPGVTLEDGNIARSIEFLRSLPGKISEVDLLPYHNTAAHKYSRFNIDNPLKGVPSLSKTDLEEVKRRFEQAGFNVRTGG